MGPGAVKQGAAPVREAPARAGGSGGLLRHGGLQVPSPSRGEAAEARRELERCAGRPEVLADPAHPPQLLAQVLSFSLAGASIVSCLLGMRGQPSPHPPGTRAGQRAPARGPGSTRASLSKPPGKQREPAPASASPERGFHSPAAG
ncbi:myosin IC heavy chain-like [Pan troglodytes]|uniref:myosin IC heavy chain-like n=1 Tax=Pan troglodytes TaxID=9598 RepID=UPI0023F34CA9|nr:myosin IC heavy chain-like [Pan troglodytes]